MTKTLGDPSVVALSGALRIPAIIGVGEEKLLISDYEMVRGSSSTRDNYRINEVVPFSKRSDSGIPNNNFVTDNFPIVSGEGSGSITNSPAHVTVTVNNSKVNILRVDGATGTIYLQSIPIEDDDVRISYYFNLTDTKITDEDVTTQFADNVGSSTDNKIIYTGYAPLVDGTNGGITTTNITDVVVKLNDSAVEVFDVDGANGKIELVEAPLSTDVVTVTYYYNTYQDTSDDLPIPGVESILRVGYAPGRADYEEGTDFVVINDKLQWGAGTDLEVNVHTPGSEYFDETYITNVQLVDDRLYKEDVSSQIDGITNIFIVTKKPLVDGSGRDNPTEDPTKVIAYIDDVVTTVIRVDGEEGKVYLSEIPAIGQKVHVTYYWNRQEDDFYTVEVVREGPIDIDPSIVGLYSVSSQEDGTIAAIGNIIETIANASFTGVNWLTKPRNTKGYSIDETVTITFTSATEFTVTSDQVTGSGTGIINSGIVGSTYFDIVTGLMFTIEADPLYAVSDTITIEVIANGEFAVSNSFNYQVPGIKISVVSTENAGTGDNTLIKTFDKAGEEPPVGDLYYITYYYYKTDYTPKIFTKFTDLQDEFGPLTPANHITMAGYFMFINGAPAVIGYQVPKQPGSGVAADVSYQAALDELRKPLSGNIKPGIIFPTTTSPSVLAATMKHNVIMSSPRYRGERISFFGFSVGTEYQDAMSMAQGYANERMIAIYPDGAIIGLVDELGTEVEYIVDGTYLAAALVGVNVSLAYDVATPMTRKNIIGFKRLLRNMDEVEMDMTANSGITIIENIGGSSLRIRHGLTTDMTSAHTREINVITIKDAVQQNTRFALDRYIGRKYLTKENSNIAVTLNGVMQTLVNNEIIIAYSGISVKTDPQDPTMVLVECYYQPVVGINWIFVTFNLRGKL